MDLKDAFSMISKGLSDLARLRRDSHRQNLEILSRFEKRAAWKGDDWSWEDFADAPQELERLRAQNLTLREINRRCEAFIARDAKTKTPLIKEIENGPADGMAERVRALVEAGEDPNGETLLKDVPLAFAHDHDRQDIFDLLIELGADPEKIGFTSLHRAVRFGTIKDVARVLDTEDVLLRRTDADPVLCEAVRSGKTDILGLILGQVETEGRIESDEVVYCFAMAIESGDLANAREFLKHGVDPNSGLDATLVRFDVQMLELLLGHGADAHKLTDLTLYHVDPLSVRDSTGQPAIGAFVDALFAAGWTVDDLGEFEHQQLRYVTGAWSIPAQDIPAEGFAGPAGRFAGDANPAVVTAPYHLEMLRTGQTPHRMRRHDLPDLPKPAWTADRYGQSTTRLADGRWVQIGGEHEDFYDPDFVIFSDVVVHDGDGGARVLFYPASVFPPTDFHTATLIDHSIWIVGNLGYQTDRNADETPVYRLCLEDFSIARVETSGDRPGWISRHDAKAEDGRIILTGGQVWTGNRLDDVRGSFVLDTRTGIWSRP